MHMFHSRFANITSLPFPHYLRTVLGIVPKGGLCYIQAAVRKVRAMRVIRVVRRQVLNMDVAQDRAIGIVLLVSRHVEARDLVVDIAVVVTHDVGQIGRCEQVIGAIKQKTIAGTKPDLAVGNVAA